MKPSIITYLLLAAIVAILIVSLVSLSGCTTPPQSTPVPVVECGKCCDGYKIPDSLPRLDTADIFGSPYPYAYQGVIWYTIDSTGPDPDWIPYQEKEDDYFTDTTKGK